MGLGRYVVEAVVVEGRSVGEVARQHGLSRSWLYKLIARYRQGGLTALEPRSRRPRSCSRAYGPELQAAIISLRHDLAAAGHDCGPHTIAHHLTLAFGSAPSVATIWRILRRAGLISPQPHKRPRSSWVRFTAELPNELWQADSTHWRLADGSDVEILNLLDDHSRLLLAADACTVVTAGDVLQTFCAATHIHGYPASLLTDNGAVFTGRSRRFKVMLEAELERLGITSKHSRPYHPQTCGKVERFHQTLKKYLAKQAPAPSLAVLQLQLDTFRLYYNQQRPHHALHGQTPLTAFHARLKARPSPALPATEYRVRRDRVDACGRVTLRYFSRLYHVALGRAHKGERVTLFVADRTVRVVGPDGDLIRELTLDPSRNYQPLGHPRLVSDVVRHVSTMS